MRDESQHTGLPFVKMHGAGNDFVIIDSRTRPAVLSPGLVRRIGDRHKGVGFDQLAQILPADDADIRLEFRNTDGSIAGACGNATRCVAHRLMEETGQSRLEIQTERGRLLACRNADGSVRVNMGMPLLEWQQVPLAHEVPLDPLPLPGGPVAVGMGNPHCVFFADDAETIDLASEGARYEHDPLFPEGTNVEFVSGLGPDRLRMRVWERGTGITLACGSGACAVAVAAYQRGLTGPDVTIEADGGTLSVSWREDGVWLSGPVSHVFDGVLAPAILDHTDGR